MVSKDIQVYHGDLGDWCKLGEMEAPAYCHCLAVLNDYLFVVGGQELFDNNGNTATNSVFRYDPRFNKWLRMQQMLDCRTDFHVSVIEGCLYAVAGRNNTGPLCTAEKYKVDRYVLFDPKVLSINIFLKQQMGIYFRIASSRLCPCRRGITREIIHLRWVRLGWLSTRRLQLPARL